MVERALRPVATPSTPLRRGSTRWVRRPRWERRRDVVAATPLVGQRAPAPALALLDEALLVRPLTRKKRHPQEAPLTGPDESHALALHRRSGPFLRSGNREWPGPRLCVPTSLVQLCSSGVAGAAPPESSLRGTSRCPGAHSLVTRRFQRTRLVFVVSALVRAVLETTATYLVYALPFLSATLKVRLPYRFRVDLPTSLRTPLTTL